VLTGGLLFAQSGISLASENATEVFFHANSTMNDTQEWPRVAMNKDGRFMTVWQSESQEGVNNKLNLYGRMFNNLAEPITTEFKVNDVGDFSSLAALHYDLDANSSGKFCIAWGANGSAGRSAYIRCYNSEGTAVTDILTVDNTSDAWTEPKVAIEVFEDGSFIVVYQFEVGFTTGLKAVRYNSENMPGNPFWLDSEGGWGRSDNVQISGDGNGRIGVTWNINDFNIQTKAAVIDADDSMLVAAFLVGDSENTRLREEKPDIAMHSDGRFVVSISQYDRDAYHYDNLQLHFFSALGEENLSKVYSSIEERQIKDPRIAANEDNIFISWSASGSSTRGYGDNIKMMAIDWNGAITQPEIHINESYERLNQIDPSIAVNDESIVIAWTDKYREERENDDSTLNEGVYGSVVTLGSGSDPVPETDTDGDGTPDSQDTDDDNDGVLDGDDAFPLDENETTDTDGDEIGNNTDTDDDNDGVLDDEDAFPLDKNETTDTDGDEIGNNADTDDDNDGMPDSYEENNGLNSLDASDANLDNDNDGYSNLAEYQTGSDPNDIASIPEGTSNDSIVGFESNETLSNWLWEFENGWEISNNVSFEGQQSLASKTINDDGVSLVDYEGDFLQGRVSFMLKTSTEESYDEIIFLIDGIIQENAYWSGENDWFEVSFDISAGEHILTWAYIKDLYLSIGQDKVWIDNIKLPIKDKSSTSTSISTKYDNDGDGKADVLWRNQVSGSNYLWEMDSLSISKAQTIESVSLDWTIAGRGDFNGDGKSDILWRNKQSGRNYVWLMDGILSTTRDEVTAISDTNWQVKAVGDFNGDGKADIFWHHQSSGRTYLWEMDGTTKTNAAEGFKISDTQWQVAGSGDINNDGNADIIWRHVGSGNNYVWLMDGVNIKTRYSFSTISTSWDIVGLSDLNGDGTDDILWRNKNDGRNWAYLMKDGQIELSQLINIIADDGWRVAMTGDFNGDGKADIFWRHQSTGKTYIYLMDGLEVMESAFSTTIHNDWKVIHH